jgi:AAA domain
VTSWEDFENQVREAAAHKAAASSASSNGGPNFSLKQLDAKRMRPTRWLFDLRIAVGSLTGLVGVGGAGKGTTVAWVIAQLTKGWLPGEFRGTPVSAIIVGDEDDIDEVWTPRIVAAGGDEKLVHQLQYDSGRSFQAVRDIDRLDELAMEVGARFIYLDQVLDHFASDTSSHTALDVRQTLDPLKMFARRREVSVAYTQHPNKMGGARAARDFTGGSGQFVDVPRNMLVLGYHPDHEDLRVLARAKGNIGQVPPALTFRIDSSFAVNPETKVAVEVGVVTDMELDHELHSDEVLRHPPKPQEEPKGSVIERVFRIVGSDDGWHSRQQAVNACLNEGVSKSAFDHEFKELDFIDREMRGREVWWKLKS